VTDPILYFNDVTVSFMARRGKTKKPINAADHVTLSVRQGEIFGLVGESGSGKSTLARLAVGLNSFASGSVVFDGTILENGKRPLALRQRIQMVFQDPYSSLDPRQTIRSCIAEVLSLHFELSSKDRDERVAGLLGDVGLAQRHASVHPRSLSGGQRQRVAIARALAAEPRVLILDEAVSALDVSVQAQILNLLGDLRQTREISYLFISHDLAVVQQVSDEVVVMHRGRIVEAGSTDDVLRAPADEYTRRLIAAVPRPGWRPQRHARTVD